MVACLSLSLSLSLSHSLSLFLSLFHALSFPEDITRLYNIYGTKIVLGCYDARIVLC